MPGARPATLVVALVGLVFTSCASEVAPTSPARLTRGTKPVARAARVGGERAGSVAAAVQRGTWPEPSSEELAELEQDAAARPASFLSGDVFGAELDESSGTAAEPEAETDPAQAISSDVAVDDDLALGATSKETFVFAAPSWGAKRIGYLRGGAVVKRSPDPVSEAGCPGGWYRVAPQGYVCVGRHATLDVKHPRVAAAARRPDRAATLPYAYGMSEFPTPPYYTKVPSSAEQRRVELDLDGHLKTKLHPGWSSVSFGPIPQLLADGRQVTTWNGLTHSPRSIYSGRALTKSGFAFLDFFESEGRKLGLTVDLDVLPLDRLRRVEPSTFRGLPLTGETRLPVVFVLSKSAHAWTGEPGKAGLRAGRTLGFREAVPITGRSVKLRGVGYLETTAGDWLRDEWLVRVDPIKQRPGWATPGRTWVDVSILRQTLVAYEGTTAVYVTLVSTGADGLGDPKDTHSTVRGRFLVHTKHVTATMSGDELGDEFDLRDVPYVQYFNQGYALHAAYWHDSFGRPRSHGCINLSPIDARWLFHWTDPPVPQTWHGAMSLREGTLVHVHP